MRRTNAALVTIAVLSAATPTFAQESPGFGALVGGLVGGAIDAATAGRRPRGGDFVPGGSGGGGSHAGSGHAGAAQGGGGQHRQAQAGGGEHKAAQGGGGQVHRKPGK